MLSCDAVFYTEDEPEDGENEVDSGNSGEEKLLPHRRTAAHADASHTGDVERSTKKRVVGNGDAVAAKPDNEVHATRSCNFFVKV